MASYTAEDVNNFMAVCAVAEPEAKRWLERYDNLASAVDKYWGNDGALPAQTQTQQMDWDETLFANTDTYGPHQKPTAFSIHAPDQPGQRPNSRVEQWVDSNNMSEEEQLNAAIAASTQDTGTTDKTTGFRSVPDSTSKANSQMMPYVSMPFSIMDSEPAAPDQRQRADDGSPAFVRPSFEHPSQIASLLTVLHNIPLAREALLGRDAANIDYGSDPHWWNGKIINNNDEYGADGAAEFFTETQRLLAALDGTDRAYVSIDALESRLRPYKNADIKLADFFRTWIDGAGVPLGDNAVDHINKLFQSEIVTSQGEGASNSEYFFALELSFGVLERRNNETLLSFLTRMFMEHRARSNAYPHFSWLADILIIQAEPPNNDTFGVKIPAKFNARRFLKDPSEAFTNMMEGYLDLDREKIAREEEKRAFSFAKAPNGNMVPYDKLLEACVAHLQQTPVDLFHENNDADGADEDLMDLGNGESEAQNKSTAIDPMKAYIQQRLKSAEDLKTKQEGVAQSIKDIDEELVRLNEQLSQYNINFEMGDDEDSPDTEYRLHGVCVGSDVLYVLARPRNSDDLLITEAEEPQWWRIQFTHGSPCEYSCTKAYEYVVRKAAYDSTEKVVLVYSNPRGLKQEWDELPPALKTFVEVDNENFQLELQGREETAVEDQEMTNIIVDPAYGQDQQQRGTTPKPWGGEYDPPQLPPRTAQAQGNSPAPISLDADSTSLPLDQNSKNGSQDSTGSKKRGARWASGIRNALSRSKSRERSGPSKAPADLLTDDAEQTRSAVVMAPNGKLSVPGSQTINSSQGQGQGQSHHEDKKAKR